MRKSGGFTLVEIMIVVAIIALIVGITVPSFMRARERSRATKTANAIRLAADAFAMYAADNHRYPDGAGPGVVPTGMGLYLQRIGWTSETPVGGQWQWKGDQTGGDLTIVQPTASLETGRDIDAMIDDGDENAGVFRLTTNHWRYTVE